MKGFPPLDDDCEKALSGMRGREVAIVSNYGGDIRCDADRKVLEKVFAGLLKHGVENTPDEGSIEVRAREDEKGTAVDVVDRGVGITRENQRIIFPEFLHTRDTSIYSSKEPYAFNAGGAGSDLLRMKIFSERMGFSISFTSNRCGFVSGDADLRPGRISLCAHARDKGACRNSGGSTFTVRLPAPSQAAR